MRVLVLPRGGFKIGVKKTFDIMKLWDSVGELARTGPKKVVFNDEVLRGSNGCGVRCHLGESFFRGMSKDKYVHVGFRVDRRLVTERYMYYYMHASLQYLWSGTPST